MEPKVRTTGDATPRRVTAVMRAPGFATRGIVFLLVGSFAVYGAEAHGLRGSLAALEESFPSPRWNTCFGPTFRGRSH